MKTIVAAFVAIPVLLSAFCASARDFQFPLLSQYELENKNMIRYAYFRCSAANAVVAARLLEHLENIPDDDEMSVVTVELMQRSTLFRGFALKIHMDANPLMSEEVAMEYVGETISSLAVKYANEYNEVKLVTGDGATSKAFLDIEYCNGILSALER